MTKSKIGRWYIRTYDANCQTWDSCVSVTSNGAQVDSISWFPNISADGRFVAFNSGMHIFVHDCHTGETSRVSIASDGTLENSMSEYSSISADGRFVAFDSYSSNLVAVDTNGNWDVFVRDRDKGETSRVSIASDGTQGSGGDPVAPSISADGRYVAFSSGASNLVPGDTNGSYDVFVHNLQTGQTRRVSIPSDGRTQGNGDSLYPSISADGRFVAFWSRASNLVAGDTNGAPDVFLHDCQTGQTRRVNIASDGTQGNRGSQFPSISSDGGLVAFQSDASNLVAGDTNGVPDVFVHSRGETARTLTVQSTPITGVWISGHMPGSTNYAATCHDQQLINLTAPAKVTAAGAEYFLLRWSLDGVDQPILQPSISVTMDAAHTVLSKWNLVGDANMDCRVNVLDLILVRNRLNQPVAVGDNWKADVNGDGKINVLDLIQARNRLNSKCP